MKVLKMDTPKISYFNIDSMSNAELKAIFTKYDNNVLINIAGNIFNEIDTNEDIEDNSFAKWKSKYEIFQIFLNNFIKKDYDNYAKRVVGSILHFLKSGIRNYQSSKDMNFTPNYELIMKYKNDKKSYISFDEEQYQIDTAFNEDKFLFDLIKQNLNYPNNDDFSTELNKWLIDELIHFVKPFDRENDYKPLSSIILAPYFIQYQLEFENDDDANELLMNEIYRYEFEKDFKDLDNFYFSNCLLIISELMQEINIKKYLTKQDIIDSLPYFNWFLNELEINNPFFEDKDIIEIGNKYTRYPIYKENPSYHTWRVHFTIEIYYANDLVHKKDNLDKYSLEEQENIKYKLSQVDEKAHQATLKYIEYLKDLGRINDFPLIYEHPFDKYNPKYITYDLDSNQNIN